MVIGTDCGGTREIVSDGMGYLYEPRNAADLAEKILAVLSNTDRWKASQLERQLYAREEFSLQRLDSEMDALMREVAKTRGSSKP